MEDPVAIYTGQYFEGTLIRMSGQLQHTMHRMALNQSLHIVQRAEKDVFYMQRSNTGSEFCHNRPYLKKHDMIKGSAVNGRPKQVRIDAHNKNMKITAGKISVQNWAAGHGKGGEGRAGIPQAMKNARLNSCHVGVRSVAVLQSILLLRTDRNQRNKLASAVLTKLESTTESIHQIHHV